MGRSLNITDSATDTDISIDIDDYETINVKSVIGGDGEGKQQQQQQLLDNINRLVQSTVSHFTGVVRKKYHCTLDQCNCGKEFLRIDAFERHVFSYTGIRKYECEQCTKKYITSSHLRRHRRTAHTVKVPAAELAGETPNNQRIRLLQQAMRSIKCKDESCRKLFLKNYSMERHYKSKHTNECKKLYECPKCNCTFQRKMRIRTHKCTPPSSSSPHHLILPNQIMEIDSSIHTTAMDIVHDADKGDDSNTTINVIQLTQLKTQEEAEEEQQQLLEIIPSTPPPPPLGSSSPLSSVDEQHEKQSPLLSQQSQKLSTSISISNNNIKQPVIITGSEFPPIQKIHKCTVCPNSIEFTKWSEFVAHRRTHHRAKYKCEQCLKEFVTKANRKYHMECVHPIDPNNRKIYKCTMDGCDRFYLHRRNLNHHLRSKHLTIDHFEKFKCNHERCGRILSTKQKLQLHIQKFHNIKEISDTTNNNNNETNNIQDDSGDGGDRYRYPTGGGGGDWDANKVMVLNVGAVVEMNEGSIMELNDVELINNMENPYLSATAVLSSKNTNTAEYINSTATTSTTNQDTIDDVIYIDTNIFEKQSINQQQQQQQQPPPPPPLKKKERKQRKDAGHKKVSTASILCEMRMDPIVDKMIIEGAGQNIELIKFPSDGEIIIPEQMLTDDCQILPIIEY